MAQTPRYPLTEREELRREIRIVSAWRPSKVPNGVVSAFLRLEDLDRSENRDLWEELREALAANPALRDRDLLAHVARPELAAQGYWWYDPDRWTLVRS